MYATNLTPLPDVQDQETLVEVGILNLSGLGWGLRRTPIFWLALAATQWKYGCLLPDVQAEAIQIIDSNAGLSRWEGRAAGTRRKVLGALRAQLLSPQPPARKPRPRRPLVVPSSDSTSPDGRAVATAYELVANPDAPRMQVYILLDSDWGRGGGGVFVADCKYDDVSLEWKDGVTLEISYPATATVSERKDRCFFGGRRVLVVYRPGAVYQGMEETA